MKSKIEWPTLEGRLSNALTSEKEALLQLQKTMVLTDLSKRRLRKCLRQEEKFIMMTTKDSG